MLSPHQVLCGRFEVQAFLGEGGMGQVWEALDLELHEHIAIKTIRSDIADAPGVLARFKREVYATRKVTHPNVCRTFDLESHTFPDGTSAGAPGKITFLTMELLRGETLAQRLRRTGPLPPDQLRILALQVANALYAAHDVGIIHCDLKPANIFMTGSESRVRAVVTDFGIAKVTQFPDETVSPILAAGATAAGGIAGTPFYMAPEQFQGRQCTAATDIYCYGLVLYEALTGQRLSPYSRPHIAGGRESRGTARGKESREPSAGAMDSATGTIEIQVIDPHWDHLLENCLRIDPGERFGHMQQVLDLLNAMPTPNSPSIGLTNNGSRSAHSNSGSAGVLSWPSVTESRPKVFPLRRSLWYVVPILALLLAFAFARYRKLIFTSQDAIPVPSVAVLPLVNVGNEAGLTAVSMDVANALTNNLAQVSGLRVPSASLVRNLDKSADVRSASDQLGVDHVVTGSISKEADELHLQVELVDAKTELELWGQSYTCNTAGLTALEGDIAQEVAFRLQMEANRSSTRKPTREHTVVPVAEEAYRKGEEAMAEQTPAGYDKAIGYFEQAIDADPQHAAAMAELSRTYSLMAYNYNRPEAPDALLNQAEVMARRALRVDSTSAEAYGSLAGAELLGDYNWTAAEKDYKRAIELDPAYLPGHVEYALPFLTAEGRFAEAQGQFAYADREKVKGVGTAISEALAAYYERRFEESALLAEESQKQAPGIWFVVELLAADYIAMGKPEKAVALIASAPVGDAGSLRDAMLGIAYARLGKKDEAFRLLQQVDSSGESGLDYHRACLAAALGLNDKAMDYLKRAYTNKESDILFVGVDPLLGPLRKDARFQLLMSKMNLRGISDRMQGESK